MDDRIYECNASTTDRTSLCVLVSSLFAMPFDARYNLEPYRMLCEIHEDGFLGVQIESMSRDVPKPEREMENFKIIYGYAWCLEQGLIARYGARSNDLKEFFNGTQFSAK